jgi:acyl-CoA synthetase (AMP-forming)/AMP-acid ligase II
LSVAPGGAIRQASPVLADVAQEAADRFGDRVAYVSHPGGAVTSYAELDRRSGEVAEGLRRSGVQEGDVVALVLGTCVQYAVAYLAAARIGAITAGVNSRLAPVERDRVLEVARARTVLIDPAAVDALAVAGGRPAPVSADPDRPVAICFTSGTTGTPKGALFAGRQLATIRGIDVGDVWGAGGTSVYATSLAHIGFMTKFAGALQSGGTAHLLPRWDPVTSLQMTERLRLSVVNGVPTQLALLLAAAAEGDYDLTSVRTIVIGGGPATPALVRAARERFGVPVCTRYSCTESGTGTGTRPDDPPEDAEETVGRPHPGVSVRIDGPDAHGVGEVLLGSAAVMSGYWRDSAGTAAALTEDGFVRTGDLGVVDDVGRLRLVGRRKEMYVRGGYNVFPVEVEAVLSTHRSVAAIAVTPRADDVMGEIGVAVVVPHRGEPAPTLDELRRYGRASLAAYKLPEALVVVDQLPLTAGDKLDRAALGALV